MFRPGTSDKAQNYKAVFPEITVTDVSCFELSVSSISLNNILRGMKVSKFKAVFPLPVGAWSPSWLRDCQTNARQLHGRIIVSSFFLPVPLFSYCAASYYIIRQPIDRLWDISITYHILWPREALQDLAAVWTWQSPAGSPANWWELWYVIKQLLLPSDSAAG